MVSEMWFLDIQFFNTNIISAVGEAGDTEVESQSWEQQCGAAELWLSQGYLG